MRYTRYEYKRKGIIKLLSSIVVITAITVSGGLYISNYIFKGNEVPNINKSNEVKEQNINVENLKIIAIQCGYYSKKENADAELTAVSAYCQPFIIEEDGKFRVIAGLYNEDSANTKMDLFKEKGIEVAKINLSFKNNTDDYKRVEEIVNGFFKITDKFEDNSVKGIKTSEFKEWCKKILSEEGAAESEITKSITEYIDNLPEELSRENIAENEKNLYAIIIK